MATKLESQRLIGRRRLSASWTPLAPHPGRVDVFICAPIDTSECGERDLQRLVEAARSAIAAKLAG